MKKTVLCVLLLLAALFCLETASADIDPENLLRSADSEIFIKAGFSQRFDEAQGYVNEFVSNDILHQYFVQKGAGIDVLTSLQASPISVETTNKRLAFADRRAKGFHAAYTVQRTEVIPEDGGSCFIRYSDAAVAGAGRESGVILYPGYKAYAFSPVDGKPEYREIADLSGMDAGDKIRVDVIRLDGVSYFYFDWNFVFQYEDGIANPVSFDGGSALNKGGNRVRCDFDEFSFIAQ